MSEEENEIIQKINPFEQLTQQILETYGEERLYAVVSKMLGYSECPPSIQQFVGSTDWLGASLDGFLFPTWRNALYDVFPDPFYSPYAEVICLAGDTQIELLSGNVATIKELDEQYRGKSFWVMSYNLKTNDWEPGKAHSVRLTNKKSAVFELTLSNGKKIKATDTHKFLTSQNSWVELKDLKIGERLKSYNKKVGKRRYSIVWSHSQCKWINLHKLVATWKHGKISPERVVHHKDCNKLNNTPENLCICSWEDHQDYHTSVHNVEKQKKRPAVKKNRVLKITSLKNIKGKNLKQQVMFILNSLIEKVGRDKVLVHTVERLRKKYFPNAQLSILKALAVLYNCLENPSSEGKASESKLRKRWKRVLNEAENYNHTVVKIEFKGYEPVYNMTVEKFHNYVLSAGVLSKNCSGAIGCFAGDVKVDLLDGRSVPIKELYENYDGKGYWVLSYDKSANSWKPAKAIFPRKTRPVASIYKVKLDNGEFFRATQDHPILMKDNSWKKVEELKTGDSLKSYNKRKTPKGYDEIWNHDTKAYSKIYDLVSKWKNGEKKSGLAVHHKNMNKHDNNPENLCLVDNSAHFQYHAGKLKTWSKKWSEDFRKGRLNYLKSEKGLKISRANLQVWRDSLTKEEYSKIQTERGTRGTFLFYNSLKYQSQRKNRNEKLRQHMLSSGQSQTMLESRWQGEASEIQKHNASIQLSARNQDSQFQSSAQKGKSLACFNKLLQQVDRKEITVQNYDELLRKHIQGRKTWLVGLAKSFNCIVDTTIEPRYQKSDIRKLEDTWSQIIDEAVNYNCKVISVEYDGEEPVYNLTVEKYHNFTLSCGVVVSNTGKTSVASIGSLYDIARLCHLEEPQRSFGVIPTKKIVYAIINVTMSLAGDEVYDQMHQLMMNSPAFKAILSKSTKRSIFPKGIDIGIGSRPSHFLGRDVIGAILDEVNFQDKVKDQAYDNYLSIKRRVQSRFMQKNGSYPGRVWLISSKNRQSDFLESHIKNSITDEKSRLFEYPIWEVLKDKKGFSYCGKTFKVFVGDETKDPRLLIGVKGTPIGLDESRIIDVPIEYIRDFELDVVKALRDMAGVSPASIFSFIPSVEKISHCLVLNNPIHKEVIQLDFFDRSDSLIKYVDLKNLIIPQYKHAQRCIHLDLALTGDRLGIASSFISSVSQETRTEPMTGIVTTTMIPHYVTEFVIAVKAKPSSEIPLFKIEEFISELYSLKYPITKVTMDGFQSANLRQNLLLKGIDAQQLSVDRPKNAYLYFKDMLMRSRWFGPQHPILFNELKNLVDVGKKIDHKADKIQKDDGSNSKDLSDAVTGSIYAAYLQYSERPMISDRILELGGHMNNLIY